jgi:hypothetical protein
MIKINNICFKLKFILVLVRLFSNLIQYKERLHLYSTIFRITQNMLDFMSWF